MARGRHQERRRARGAIIIATVVGTVCLVAGAGAYAAYRYEQMRADRILPGVRIEGLDVSGLNRDEAERALKVIAKRTLARQLTVEVGNDRWTTTAATLGRHALIHDAVDHALAISSRLGTFDRFWHRFRDEPLDIDIDLAYTRALPGLAHLVDSIAETVAISPRDARLDIDADRTGIRRIHAQEGAKLMQPAAEQAIEKAFSEGSEHLRLRTVAVSAKVTDASLGPTIVVHVDRNRLELYDGFSVEQTWSVATAKPGYTTPVGVWTIWDERENPTWYNPALDSWGAGLPAVVPGGPGNPMGTRAIYIDAPGLIRIHGTTDDSSIGRYASHGCIRMHNEEIEDLFERIPVGAHVIIVGYRPAGAAYWDTPGPADI